MKIVQFKNGKYGIRRRDPTTFWIEVQFMSRHGWWRLMNFPSADPDYNFDTIQEAQAIIKKSEAERKRIDQILSDKGKPVKL